MQTRRSFLTAAVATAALIGTPPIRAAANGIQAVAFDGFTIFDPRPMLAAAKERFPDKGEALGALWRVRQFEYSWLRTLTGRYADFRQLTDEALTYAAQTVGVALTDADRAALMQAFLDLKLWPDSAAALTRMKEAGLRLAYLSNLPVDLLKSAGEKHGIADLFEHVLSTDLVQAYKPDPRTYAMAEPAFKLPKSAILFAAFGGYDAAGARTYGFETFWVNRLGLPREQMGAMPDGEGRTLNDLADYAIAHMK